MLEIPLKYDHARFIIKFRQEVRVTVRIMWSSAQPLPSLCCASVPVCQWNLKTQWANGSCVVALYVLFISQWQWIQYLPTGSLIASMTDRKVSNSSYRVSCWDCCSCESFMKPVASCVMLARCQMTRESEQVQAIWSDFCLCES